MRVLFLFSILSLQCALPKDLAFPFLDCGEEGCPESAPAPASIPVVSYPNPPDKPCEVASYRKTFWDGVWISSYNAMGNVQEENLWEKGKLIWTVKYAYDKRGNLISTDEISNQYERSWLQFRYSYDSLNRKAREDFLMTNVGCEKGPVYDSDGFELCSLTSGYYVDYTYDGASKNPKSSTVSARFKSVFEYDAHGSVIKEEGYDVSKTPPLLKGTTVYTFTYKKRKDIKESGVYKTITYKDREGRKTLVEHWDGSKLQHQNSFTYDAKGRLLTDEYILGSSTLWEKRSYRYECRP
jgi:hypothetical protein